MIADLLELPPGSVIADLGAGTGNYANALADLGHRIIAIEPSAEMEKQAVPHPEVAWISGVAEALPLHDSAVDGIVMVLALHHFSNVEHAAREAARICPQGPLVVFTMDPRESEDFWFYRYFPEIADHVWISFPPLGIITSLFQSQYHWSAAIKEFPLPADLTDRNMCSGWNHPEVYLDAQMRQNTSGFALAAPEVVQKGLYLLQKDLQSDTWDRHYGQLRNRSHFDAGFRFLKFQA